MKKYALLVFIPLLIASCDTSTTSVIDPSSTSPSISSVTPSTSSTSTSRSDSSTISSTSSSTSSHEEVVKMSLLEARTYCLALTNPNEQGVIESDTLVEVDVKALMRGNTLKSSAGYLPYGKVFIADETSYMYACSQTQTPSFYQYVENYVGKENANYTLTGYLCLNNSVPELKVQSYKVCDKSISYDLSSYQIEASSISYFTNAISTMKYNTRGYGYADVYHFASLKCLAKADDNSWIFSDGNSVIGVYNDKSNTSFTVNNVYEVSGVATLKEWRPSLTVLTYKALKDVEIPDPYVNASATSIDYLRKNMTTAPHDSSSLFTSFIAGFNKVYKANLYVNYYTQSGKIYLTVGDTKSAPTSLTDAVSKNLFVFNNDSCWNISNLDHCPLTLAIGSSQQVEIYFTLYQEDQISNKCYWKIYMFENMIDLSMFESE